MHNQFKVRKFTDNELEPKPYEVLYVDYANNNIHSSPDMSFSFKIEAQTVCSALNALKDSANAKKWPIVGPIPQDLLH